MLSDADRDALEMLDSELRMKQEDLKFKRELIAFVEAIEPPKEGQYVLAYADPNPNSDSNLRPAIFRLLPDAGDGGLKWSFIHQIVNKHAKNCLEEIKEAISERLRS